MFHHYLFRCFSPLILIGSLLSVLLFFPIARAQQVTPETWRNMLYQADVKRIMGDQAGAEQLYGKAISEMDVLPPKSQLEVLKAAIRFYDTQNDYHKLQQVLERALTVESGISGGNSIEMASFANALGKTLKVLKSYDRAANCLHLAIKIVEDERGTGDKTLVSLFENLAEVYQLQNKPELAATIMRRKQQLTERMSACEDLKPNRFDDYIKIMQQRIRADWHPPKDLTANNRVILRYVIMENGVLDRITIKESSKIKKLDNSAIEAVRQASPLPPPPKTCNDFIPVDFIFDYDLIKSKQEPLIEWSFKK